MDVPDVLDVEDVVDVVVEGVGNGRRGCVSKVLRKVEHLFGVLRRFVDQLDLTPD